MVNIGVINRFVLFGRHLSVVNGLDLVPVSQVGVVCRLDFIIVIIGFGGCQLMLGCCLKMMRSFPMMIRRFVVNGMFMLGCHPVSP